MDIEKIKKKYLKENYVKYFLLAVLLIILFVKTYSIHFDYPFPYHHDEWQHLGITLDTMETGYDREYNRRFVPQRRRGHLAALRQSLTSQYP